MYKNNNLTNEQDVIEMLYHAVRYYSYALKDIRIDGDHKSSSVSIKTENNHWLISSQDIKNMNPAPFTEQLRIAPEDVPKKFGMYTYQGNRSIRNKFIMLIKKLNDRKDHQEAFESFMKSYIKMYNSGTMGEAADTAVREAVLDYAEGVARVYGINDYIVSNTFEKAERGRR